MLSWSIATVVGTDLSGRRQRGPEIRQPCPDICFIPRLFCCYLLPVRLLVSNSVSCVVETTIGSDGVDGHHPTPACGRLLLAVARISLNQPGRDAYIHDFHLLYPPVTASVCVLVPTAGTGNILSDCRPSAMEDPRSDREGTYPRPKTRCVRRCKPEGATVKQARVHSQQQRESRTRRKLDTKGEAVGRGEVGFQKKARFRLANLGKRGPGDRQPT